ncbi:selenium metabolism-associated LysR family transcriptional regulator [Cytobacillus dafuensis]|uniref:LysR family transcriptional regulator n=1 Tax=Cytobacillus dafuensis TaxID=1742359 RepID=A0A5B8Z7S4_CYTDA|nr:selenium metabolism-associated LysR family transcriptional regulator [Cytobacillus dafuensis]QED49014.1 LysR family transcriptional regulator [Cytobacillus dafuensis]
MDLHQLFIFTKVVEHKSFSKAADDIFLSQSTVSSHIQALEKSLNLKLFDRDGRETILTPHGERLHAWAQQILLLRDKAILDLKTGMMDFRGIVRIAASSVPSSFIIPNLISIFTNSFPNITFHVTEASSKTVAHNVLNRSVDIGVLGEKYENDKLCYLPFQKEKLVLITSNQVKLEKDAVCFDDIIKYPLIMRNSDSGTQAQLNKYFKKNGVSKEQLQIAAYTESGNSLIQFVKQGIGISIISEVAAKEYAAYKMIRMHEIKDFLDERYIYLVYHKNKTLSLAAKLFIENAKSLVKST